MKPKSIHNGADTTRRRFLFGAATAATLPLLAGRLYSETDTASTANAGSKTPTVSDRRKLGSLEVSSIGLGVQNMSRTYQTTIPNRSEMLNIIRTAFNRGVIFYYAAEAYGHMRWSGSSAKALSRSGTRS
jgi:hypothetical protein